MSKNAKPDKSGRKISHEKKVFPSGQTVQGLGSLVKKHDKVVMERAPGFVNLSTNFKL